MRSLLFVGALAGALLAGCSSEPIKINEMVIDTSRYDNLGEVHEGKTGLLIWPGCIPLDYNDLMKNVMDRAIANKGGDQLVNVTVNQSWWWAWFIQGFKVEVDGTVIKKKA